MVRDVVVPIWRGLIRDMSLSVHDSDVVVSDAMLEARNTALVEVRVRQAGTQEEEALILLL